MFPDSKIRRLNLVEAPVSGDHKVQCMKYHTVAVFLTCADSLPFVLCVAYLEIRASMSRWPQQGFYSLGRLTAVDVWIITGIQCDSQMASGVLHHQCTASGNPHQRNLNLR